MVRIYKYEDDAPLYEVYFNIRSRSGRRTQKRIRGFKTKSEAERQETKLLREAERDLIEKEAAGETWKYVVDKFEENISKNENLKAHTRLDYVAAVRKHTEGFMNRPISSITRVDAKALFTELSAKGLSIGHQKKIKIILNRLHAFAADEGMMSEGVNPFRAVEFPKEEEKVPEILSIEEIRLLLKTARDIDHPWYPVWAMALLTGMRNGELYALTFQDVDFDNKLITLSRSYNTRTRSTKSTKSGYWRQIPISAELEVLLKELKLRAGTRKEVLPRLPGWEKGVQAKVLRAFCQVAGLPSIKFHTLRACFATQLIRTGVPPIQIQKICGWKDLETMQIYIRLAGIEVQGVTDGLRLLPETEVMGKVVSLFGGSDAP